MTRRATDGASVADLDAVASLPAEEQRALYAHERRQGRLVAVRAHGRDTRQLVFHPPP